MEGAQPAALTGALKAAIAIYALITLAPKALSLLAGTICAGIVIALQMFTKQLGVMTVITTVFSFEANVLLLTP